VSSDREYGIRLTADGKQLVGEVRASREELEKLGAATGKASSDAATLSSENKNLSSSFGSISSIVKTVAASYAVLNVAEYAREAALLSARYETLGVSMRVVGNNAGYTGAEMEAAAVGMQKTGISMVESRQQALRLVQAHIDLAQSSKLARIAQDAAVIGNMNSSAAFATMIHGIQTGQTDVLRTIGLNISMEQSYDEYAATLHKSTNALTQTEKTQAVLNAVMREGEGIAGTYEAAMGTAGKAMNSLSRWSENLKLKLGEVFLPALAGAVFGYTDALKAANREADNLAQQGSIKKFAEGVLTSIVALTAATATYAGVLAAQMATGAASAVTSFIAMTAAHGQALAINVAMAAAQQTELSMTKAAIVETRSLAASKLAAANANVAAAEIFVASARATGAGLHFQAQAEAELTLAMQARSAATAELATLGAQQARVTAAQSVAATELAAAQTLAAGTGSIWTRVLFGTSVAADLAAGSLSKMALGLNVLMAAFVGWEIGTWLNNFSEVRIAGLSFVGAMLQGFESVKYGAQIAAAAVTSLVPGSESFASAKAKLTAAHNAESAAIEKNITEMVAYELQVDGSAKATGGMVAKVVVLADGVSKTVSEYDKLIKKLSGELVTATAGAEAAQHGYNKEQTKALELFASPEWATYSQKQRNHIAGIVQQKIDQEQLTAATKEYQKIEDAALARAADSLAAQLNGTQSIVDGTKQMREHTAEIGLTAAALLGLQKARIDDVIAIKERSLSILTASGFETEATKTIRDEIAALQDRKAAMGEAFNADTTAAAAKKHAESAKKYNEEINRSLTDALMRGWESGKGFAQNFIDTVKNMFKTLILRPVISAVLSPVSGAIASGMAGLGFSGPAAATGGTPGIMGMPWGGSSMLGGGISMLGNAVGSAGMSAFGTGMGLSAAQAAAASGAYSAAGMSGIGSALSAGSMLGAALPWIGGALAVGSALGMFGGGKGYASTTGYDYQGNYNSASGIAGTAYGHSANSRESYRFAMSEASVSWNRQIAEGLAPVVEAMRRSADILGLDASIVGRADLTLSGSGTSSESAIAMVLGSASDQMARSLVPNIENFAQANESLTQTFVRLVQAAEQAQVAVGQGLVGGMKTLIGLADKMSALYLSDLSPLTASERLSAAGGQYATLLAQARAGDMGAVDRLGGAAQTYLQEGRSYYASSQDYTALFSDVQGAVGDLVGNQLTDSAVAITELAVPLDAIVKNTQDLDKRIADLLAAAIAARAETDAAVIRAQTEAIVRATLDAARVTVSAQQAGTLA